jgi:DNA invertase Pin-like site-specific DNA recombinase
VLSVRRCVPWPLKARGVALHLLDLGGDISGNGLSKLFLTIAAAFAEAERDRIRERIGQVKADQKARGRNLGGKVPFGYPRASPRVSQFESPQLHQLLLQFMLYVSNINTTCIGCPN